MSAEFQFYKNSSTLTVVASDKFKDHLAMLQKLLFLYGTNVSFESRSLKRLTDCRKMLKLDKQAGNGPSRRPLKAQKFKRGRGYGV